MGIPFHLQYLNMSKSQSHCLSELYNVYSKQHPALKFLIQVRENLPKQNENLVKGIKNERNPRERNENL